MCHMMFPWRCNMMQQHPHGRMREDKAARNRPDLWPRGIDRDRDEYGFPLKSETRSTQVICSEISASESLPLFRLLTEVIYHTVFSFFVPQATVKIKMQLSEVATSNHLIFPLYLSLSDAKRHVFLSGCGAKTDKGKTYPCRTSESRETAEASAVTGR